MRVRKLTIENYRGIAKGEVEFLGHTLLVGGNNSGKSTVCEALDLVLGPERLGHRSIVDEHDFHRGRYMIDEAGNPITIRIEALLVDLSAEARRRFNANLRRWDERHDKFVDEAGEGPEAADREGTYWALPIVFLGRYSATDDDFEGDTFFAHPKREVDPTDEEASRRLGAGLTRFSREHKRMCGFVFLRALRTGTRALSLQRGSLLDTVLRSGGGGLSEMWLQTLRRLQTRDRRDRPAQAGPDRDPESHVALRWPRAGRGRNGVLRIRSHPRASSGRGALLRGVRAGRVPPTVPAPRNRDS
ncbi:MAG: ATP-dependent nuclease [Vicinamibacteria bacterium]